MINMGTLRHLDHTIQDNIFLVTQQMLERDNIFEKDFFKRCGVVDNPYLYLADKYIHYINSFVNLNFSKLLIPSISINKTKYFNTITPSFVQDLNFSTLFYLGYLTETFNYGHFYSVSTTSDDNTLQYNRSISHKNNISPPIKFNKSFIDYFFNPLFVDYYLSGNEDLSKLFNVAEEDNNLLDYISIKLDVKALKARKSLYQNNIRLFFKFITDWFLSKEFKFIDIMNDNAPSLRKCVKPLIPNLNILSDLCIEYLNNNKHLLDMNEDRHHLIPIKLIVNKLKLHNVGFYYDDVNNVYWFEVNHQIIICDDYKVSDGQYKPPRRCLELDFGGGWL